MRFILVGHTGYWGKKLARNIEDCGHSYFGIDQSNVDEFNPDKGDAVIIATPPDTHYFWAMRAMKMGLDVLVEKPMAMLYSQAKAMQDFAEKHLLVLSVDSTFVHTRAFEHLKGLQEPLLSYQSIRLAPPMPQAKITAGWDLIVHDLSIIQGLSSIDHNAIGVEDGPIAQCGLELSSGGTAFIFASRAWPTKERSVTLHFPSGTYLWTLSGVEKIGTGQVAVEGKEPLKRLIEDFALRCTERLLSGVSDGAHGAEVVKCLERLFPAHSSIGMGGRTMGTELPSDQTFQHLSV